MIVSFWCLLPTYGDLTEDQTGKQNIIVMAELTVFTALH